MRRYSYPAPVAEDPFYYVPQPVLPLAHKATALPTPDLAMISLPIASETAKLLALPAGNDPETLHITLIFLGEWEAYASDVQQAIQDAVTSVAKTQAPLFGQISGFGCFTPVGDPDKVLFALPHMHGLHGLHCALKEALPVPGKGQFDGFIPHITLMSLPMNASLPFSAIDSTPLTCNTMQLVVADTVALSCPLEGGPHE
jgi:2'-5' RNA ligase